MPEKTQQFAQNIARSLIGEEAAHPAQPLIQMQGIRKSYYIGQPNELEILHGIDLTVYPGEFVAIVGESGSGKSTLMNIIGVLDKPTAGEYVLDGVNIHDADDNDLAAIRNRKIGLRSFIAAIRANKAAEVTVGVISIIILVLTKDAILSVADFRCFCILIKRNINAESNNFIRDFLRH